MQERQIYKSRQALIDSETELSQETVSALAQARRRAVALAQEKHPHRAGSASWAWARLWPNQAWGAGLTAVSVAAVLVGLQIAERATFDENLNRLASIDQKMISGPLPVQAYLDPGFLIFQESTIEQTDNAASRVAGGSSLTQRAADMRQFWSAESLFPGVSVSSQGPSWAKLSASQKEALGPLESLWNDMEAHRKQKWIRIADRFHMLSPEQQRLAQERMQEWVSLPAIDRRQARAVYDGVNEVIPEDVRVMKWNEYQKLSPKERERLIELAQARVSDADPAKRTDVPVSGDKPTTPRSALSKHSDKPFAAQ